MVKVYCIGYEHCHKSHAGWCTAQHTHLWETCGCRVSQVQGIWVVVAYCDAFFKSLDSRKLWTVWDRKKVGVRSLRSDVLMEAWYCRWYSALEAAVWQLRGGEISSTNLHRGPFFNLTTPLTSYGLGAWTTPQNHRLWFQFFFQSWVK